MALDRPARPLQTGVVRRILLLLLVLAVSPAAASARDVPITCATAKLLARAAARPVWFPAPPPPGRFSPRADALPIFVRGLVWRSAGGYFWLVRIPGGANLGEIGLRSKVVARPYLPGVRRKVRVLRLAGDGRLYAEWPTLGRYPDVTAAVGKGERLAQFVARLRSLRQIAWPKGCG